MDHVPVWFMRQAGRSLPEYRAARGTGSILDAIARPELVAELTRQPVARYGTDAAILFSDIVVPVAAIGFGVDVAPGIGPVVAEPFRRKDDLQRIRPLEPPSTLPTSPKRWPSWRPAGRPPHRLCRSAVHGGQLSRRRGAVPELRQGQGAHAERAGASGTNSSKSSAISPWPPCAPARRRCRRRPGLRQLGRNLTPGTTDLVLPATARLFAELAESHPGVPTILFGSAPASCWLPWPQPAAPSSVWTGGSRWTKPVAGSDPVWPSRATSTPPCA